MATANYHQPDDVIILLSVLKENSDGTVDLGKEGGDPIVTSCPVSDVPVVGHCVLVKSSPEKVESDKSTKKQEDSPDKGAKTEGDKP